MNILRLLSVLLFLLLSLPFLGHSQSYIGNTLDNNSGVHSLLLNPANVVGSKTKFEFNIISASAFVGNDYLGVDFRDLKNIGDGFSFDSDVAKTPTDRNNFFGNADVLGPSVMFRLNEKSSLGINTRVRTFFNIHNISGLFYESISEGFDSQSDFQTEMEDLSGTVHAWGEIGLTYGRIILDDETSRLKIGTTLKYLGGAGGLFTSSPQLSAAFNSQAGILTTGGTLDYGYTSDFDTENIEFTDFTGGFGADFGLVYELRAKSGVTSDSLYTLKPYKFRFGISVLDIGAINYQDITEFNYNMNGSVSVSEFDEKDIEDVLNDNFQGTEVIGNRSLGLPSSLQGFIDYSVSKKFFLSMHGAFSLRDASTFKANNIINTISVTPRFESKWLSIYSPFSLRQYQSGIMWGVGFRSGPFMIGSGSVLSNLLSSSSKSTDVFIGFKVPIFKD
ncbi:hypothetical protein [Cognataquiflexum rubidum]|uniref:hypothetical protein n=1 Tax=Cognataquiflexum rubidum TaxID=2922273 RepID=UPI001F141EB1|nr:hypothetical protein [Cognataquiflexum rubidum]MCH6235049.1 hypothetical protein [Cognataquiflexum rubidum]